MTWNSGMFASNMWQGVKGVRGGGGGGEGNCFPLIFPISVLSDWARQALANGFNSHFLSVFFNIFSKTSSAAPLPCPVLSRFILCCPVLPSLNVYMHGIFFCFLEKTLSRKLYPTGNFLLLHEIWNTGVERSELSRVLSGARGRGGRGGQKRQHAATEWIL